MIVSYGALVGLKTQAISVKEGPSVTVLAVTRLPTPSKESASPKRPPVVHVAPEMVAVRLFPERSAVVVPLPSSNAYAATTPPSGGDRLKVAVTDLAALMVTAQVIPETVSQPVQPLNVDPVAAAAVRVTIVDWS